jgi:hypothetical protein
MKPPYQLVPDSISPETVQALRELLEQSQRRTDPIIGIAFAAMYRGRTYIVNTAGEARRNPTFTRGMLAALDDRLGEFVVGQ